MAEAEGGSEQDDVSFLRTVSDLMFKKIGFIESVDLCRYFVKKNSQYFDIGQN